MSFWKLVGKILFDYCPKCESFNVTKVKTGTSFRYEVEYENFDFTCQSCGHNWKDSKKKKIEVDHK
jgi:transposase-like protein